ncbi:hypothetical protein OPQ81_002799 [Rhizoctonia solani]|nr:hypothetical protein OPQ81_002799 [Rhizoctonia solani]
MSASTRASIRNRSFYSDQNILSPVRSDSVSSYPSYAPPTYEAATAISIPNNILEPETLETPQAGSSRIEPIDPSLEFSTSDEPLDPHPLIFRQVPKLDVAHEPLPQPFVVHAKPGAKSLEDMFEIVGTNALEQYDVLARNWMQMLQDIREVAQLTKRQRFVARVLPVTMYMGCTGFFVSRAIEREMKRKNGIGVLGLLDVWNERFFKPRGECL